MDKSNVDIITENLMSVHHLLHKGVSKSIRSQSTSPGEVFVLGSLNRHGVLSMSNIGKCIGIPKSHVTIIVDKLIADGCVERQCDPNDRRIVNIELTKVGKERYAMIKSRISEELKDKLRGVDSKELDILIRSTQEVKDILFTRFNFDTIEE